MRRFFQAAVFSLLVTGALVVAAPSKRTATARPRSGCSRCSSGSRFFTSCVVACPWALIPSHVDGSPSQCRLTPLLWKS